MLLDTSGLLCFLDQRESRHGNTVTLFASAATRLTHNYVIAELVALAQSRNLARTVVLEFCRDIATSPHVRFEWVDADIHAAALDLLVARPDKTWSLCDAVSFVIMTKYGILEALTTDHHFEQAGFVQLLPS